MNEFRPVASAEQEDRAAAAARRFLDELEEIDRSLVANVEPGARIRGRLASAVQVLARTEADGDASRLPDCLGGLGIGVGCVVGASRFPTDLAGAIFGDGFAEGHSAAVATLGVGKVRQ